MKRSSGLFITFFCIVLILGCSSIEQKNWMALIPEESSFIIVPKRDIDLQNIGATEYASILDDLTPSALQQLGALPDSILQSIDLKALVLYPASSTRSQFIWLSRTSGNLEVIAPGFYEPFEQNNYSFNGLIIHKLHFNGNLMFAAQVHEWLVISESSLAVESALRSYIGLSGSLDMNAEPTLSLIHI